MLYVEVFVILFIERNIIKLEYNYLFVMVGGIVEVVFGVNVII